MTNTKVKHGEMMRRTRFCVLLILLSPILGCDRKLNSSPLRVGIIPAQTEGEMAIGIKHLQEHLAKTLGRAVEIEVYPEYNGVVEAINYRKLDIAYLGPFTYVVAHHKSGAKAIVTQLINGKPFYFSKVIVPASSHYKTLDDLIADKANVRLMFGSINSTSGCLVPAAELLAKGVYRNENDHDFKSLLFGGSHDVVALSVQNQFVDAGAVDSAFLASFEESGKIDASKIREIWISEKLFQYPWTVRGDMDDALIGQIQESFLRISDPYTLRAFGGASGFTKCSDKDYDRIREIAKSLGKLD
jgi:phosphonate transport system substrate-binding protein